MSHLSLPVIGLVDGAIAQVDFPASCIPGPRGELGFPSGIDAGESFTSLYIAVGMDQHGGLNQAGGDIPDIEIFTTDATTEQEISIGSIADLGYIDKGMRRAIYIDQGLDTRDATGVSLDGHNNAVCIAFIGARVVSDRAYGWLGDWGAVCGAPWYYSNYTMADEGGATYNPLCTWIDGKGDIPTKKIDINMEQFTREAWAEMPTIEDMCDTRILRFITGDGSYVTDISRRSVSQNSARLPRNGRARENEKSSSRKSRQRHHDNKLVVSKDAVNHATERLCKSEISVGPDFVNVAEGQFCQMSDHTIWPLCSPSHHKDDCFDLGSQKLIVGGKVTRDEGYARVEDWSNGALPS